MAKVSDAFVMLEKCGLPQAHTRNMTLSRVEYDILEALNGTTKANNQEQQRKSRGIAQCTNCRMQLMRLLRNLSIIGIFFSQPGL
jgi:ribosomal protein S14